MKRFRYALAAALVLGATLAALSALFSAPVGAQLVATRCGFADVDAQTQRPCIAIGSHTSPAGQTVDFTSDIPGAASFQLVGTETPGALPTAPQSLLKLTDQMAGTYTITQVVPTGFSGRWLACDGSGAASWAVTTVTDNSITLRVGPGAFVTCDFVAVRHQLVIVKDASPADGTDFSFGDGGAGFVLDDADPDDADAIGSQIGLPVPFRSSQFGPRSLTVTEAAPPGWTLTSIACTESPDGLGGDVTNIATTSNSVTVDTDDVFAKTVTCTFRNSKAGASAALAGATAACIESPQVQTDTAAASLRVGNTFRGSNGVRYLIVTGERSCSFNCDMGADANCDNVLGDYCAVELDLTKVRDVGVCLTALTPVPAPAAAPATAQPPADAGLAHTGSETTLANAGLGFIALGAAALAAAARRRRTLA